EPDRDHGYCIDDNARALILTQKFRAIGAHEAVLARLETIYAKFVEDGWNASRGRFRNFMDEHGAWLEDVGSEDSNGRTFWCLGEVAPRAAHRGLGKWALDLARRTAPLFLSLQPLRAQVFCLLGADAALRVAPEDNALMALIERGAETLRSAFAASRRADWVW